MTQPQLDPREFMSDVPVQGGEVGSAMAHLQMAMSILENISSQPMPGPSPAESEMTNALLQTPPEGEDLTPAPTPA